MALRLRRGTDAERQLITPVEGELIYTTDTKLLYIGDGSSAGGVLVTGSAGSTTLDGLTDTDLAGATNGDMLSFNSGTNKWEPVANEGVVEGANYSINIVGDNSTIIVDADTNTFTGNLVGDAAGDHTGTFTGTINAVGTLDGDVTGSVFGDNSTLIVDGINNTLSAEELSIGNVDIRTSDFSLLIENDQATHTLMSGLTDGSWGSTLSLRFNVTRGTLDVPQNTEAGDYLSDIKIAGLANDEYKIASYTKTKWADAADLTQSTPRSILEWIVGAGTGNGVQGYRRMQFRDDNVLEGPIFQNLNFADATARDAEITSPAAGMIVFLTDTSKFSGYNGTAWDDLN